MGCGIDLSCLPLGDIAQSPLRKHFSFSAQHLRYLSKTLFQGLGLFETATLLHALLHSVRGGGSATRDLITDKYHGPCGDDRAYSIPPPPPILAVPPVPEKILY